MAFSFIPHARVFAGTGRRFIKHGPGESDGMIR
jgi:hypothetical protein